MVVGVGVVRMGGSAAAGGVQRGGREEQVVSRGETDAGQALGYGADQVLLLAEDEVGAVTCWVKMENLGQKVIYFLS